MGLSARGLAARDTVPTVLLTILFTLILKKTVSRKQEMVAPASAKGTIIVFTEF